jgi:hypothetical protein
MWPSLEPTTKVIDASGNAACVRYDVDRNKAAGLVEKWPKATSRACAIATDKIAGVVIAENRRLVSPGSVIGRKGAGGKQEAMRTVSSEIVATDNPFVIDPKGLGTIAARWSERLCESSITSARECFRTNVAKHQSYAGSGIVDLAHVSDRPSGIWVIEGVNDADGDIGLSRSVSEAEEQPYADR